MAESVEIVVITLILFGALSHVRSDALKHKYKRGEPVPFYANKVGPFSNPSETYAYYSLPFCLPDYLEEKEESLGERLNGDRLVNTPYKLDFLVDKDSQLLCRKNLTKEQVSQLQTAISLDYYSQMYYDDLPVWCFIGLVHRGGNSNPDEYFIFTHLHFEIFYNGNHVIEINVRSDPSNKTEMMSGNAVSIDFFYSVKWKETNSPFYKRMEKYAMAAILPHHLEIHRSSITNSFWTNVILVGCLVALYLCVLRRDFSKYINDEELPSNNEERGWKILHGDVFRFPKHKSLFTAATGSGIQLLVFAMIILILGFAGVFRPYDRGTMKTVTVFTYAITFGIAGFMSVSFYHQLEGREWVKNLVLSGSLFSSPFFLTFCFLNIVATVYGTTTALPLGTILVISLVYIFLAMPLLSLGGIAGKVISFEFQAPCRTRNIPRDIPAARWYRNALPQMLLAGLLLFSVIYVELYYIIASAWGHRVYTLYGVLCIIFILLLISTALVSIGLTYFQLAAEDHQWWWRSFLCGGSTGLYVFAYSIFYYFERSNMQGFFQTSFFFGYMACICYGIFLMLGAVAFHASLIFVRHIYSNIRCD